MSSLNWKRISLGIGAAGVAAGIWAVLRWGNRYLDEFENITGDEYATGHFLTTADGYRLHYTVEGAGSPVVLIHGFMDSHRTWRRNMQMLTQYHRVYALDVVGFGSSERVRAPIYTLKIQAQLLREFFQRLNIGPAAVIGHSLGGALALQFAYDFPELVHKLVLIAPATYLYAAFPRYGLRPVPRGVSRGVLGIYERLRGGDANPLLLAYGDPSRITQDSVRYRSDMLRMRGTHDSLIAMSKSNREADVPQKLPEVRVPALIVWGKQDHVVPAKHALRHSEALPNARLVWIETAGHLPHEEEPEQVNQLIQDFLQDQNSTK